MMDDDDECLEAEGEEEAREARRLGGSEARQNPLGKKWASYVQSDVITKAVAVAEDGKRRVFALLPALCYRIESSDTGVSSSRWARDTSSHLMPCSTTRSSTAMRHT